MIVFVDIETTGTIPGEHEVIEVGMVAAEKGQIVLKTDFSLPFDEEAADPKALEINGWGKREFAPMISRIEARETINAYFEVGDEFFCAWHTMFDAPFLHLDLWPTKKPPWSHSRVIDLPSLILGHRGIIIPGRLNDLAPRLGVDPEKDGRHSALHDAELNFEIYKELRLWEVVG